MRCICVPLILIRQKLCWMLKGICSYVMNLSFCFDVLGLLFYEYAEYIRKANVGINIQSYHHKNKINYKSKLEIL